jgi:predicted nucleic acid-binding protein
MAEGRVVDTDVLSYLFRGDTRIETFRPSPTGASLIISSMTVAELERWAVRRDWGMARREQMAEFLNQFTLILVNRALCHTWAEVSDRARRRGRPIQTADAWIAATALALDVPLVTNNRDGFAGVPGLSLLPEPNAPTT